MISRQNFHENLLPWRFYALNLVKRRISGVDPPPSHESDVP